MYVCMYVCKLCMYVCTCMYVCMYVCVYVCMHVCMYYLLLLLIRMMFQVQLLYASLVSDDTPVPLGDHTTSQLLSNDNLNGLVNFPSNT